MSEHPKHSPSGHHDPAERTAQVGPRRINFRPINLLLLIPLIGTLPPMFYNKVAPSIGGMPFFYWYQLLWIPISVTLTYIVYRATRGER
jgi:uncharacterized protein DUF3311